MSNKPVWPADEPWYQFTPRNIGTGYLSLVAGALMMIWSGVELIGGGLNLGRTIMWAVIGVLGLALLFQSTAGLRKLLRHRNEQR